MKLRNKTLVQIPVTSLDGKVYYINPKTTVNIDAKFGKLPNGIVEVNGYVVGNESTTSDKSKEVK